MFVYRSRFLTRAEVWFDEEPDGARVDWIYHRQRSAPLAGYQSKPFYTVLVDLRKSPTALLAGMEERTARRIVEAQEKDGLRCTYCNARDTRLLDEVEQMWNQFAVAQHTPRLEREWVDQISQAGDLNLVAAKDTAGNVLAYHLVFLAPKRARQLIAISPYRAVPSVAWRHTVSRANCLAHWHNFLSFRERGISSFDFGGWYPGTTDIRSLGINRFKQSFGGGIVREYECEQPVTLKGWTLLTAAQMLTRFRRSRRDACTTPENQTDAKALEEHQVSA